MSGDQTATEALRTLLARHGLAFSEADLAVGAGQLEAIRQALEQLDQFEVAALEPTTYVRFDDQR